MAITSEAWVRVIILILLAIIACIFVDMFIQSVSADVFVYGENPNFSAVVLPNNSYVHQGENISQGNYYDLTGIYGFSGVIAWWKDQYNQGSGQPDITITLDGSHATYIDPAIYPLGQYFQWDGNYCATGSDVCYNGFKNDNAYVFAVVPPLPNTTLENKTKTVTYTSNITILQKGSSVQVPVTYTQIETETPEPTTPLGVSGTIAIPTTIIIGDNSQNPNIDVQDQNGIPINGGVAGAVEVTQKASVPVWIGIIAIALIVLWRKREIKS